MGSPKKRIQYRYDSVGNRIGMTDPDGGRFTYSYDAVNRITQVINPQGDRTSYAYDVGGRRTVKKLANGTRASFSYDAASNLTRLANLKSDGTTISSFNYDYDRVGNRTAVLEADGSRVTWSYDDTYQLTGEHRSGTTPYEDSYSYDAAGNRLLKIHDGARTTYAYDAANQLEWTEDASGRTTFVFDADGNQQLVVEPTGDRTTTSWDYENRTTLAQLPSGIRNTMAYEPGGLRVKLEESTGTKKFVWDEQNYLAETDENDDTQVVYTNEPRLYGNLVSQRRGTDSDWYHFDVIGSMRELTDVSESVTDTRLYDAWGIAVSSSGVTDAQLWYVGKLGYSTAVDSNSLYVRARYLLPALGRWSARDPLYSIVLPANPFVYATNQPATHVDASGLLTVHCPGALTEPIDDRPYLGPACKFPGFDGQHDPHWAPPPGTGCSFDLTADETSDLSREGFRHIFVLQSVCIHVDLTIGFSDATEQSCRNQLPCCEYISLEYDGCFIEGIPINRRDAQTGRVDERYFTMLRDACGKAEPFNPCCAYSYWYHVTKTAAAVALSRNIGNTVISHREQGSVDCGGTGLQELDPRPDPPTTMPDIWEGGKFLFRREHPRDVWVSNLELQLDHSECGPVDRFRSWPGYSALGPQPYPPWPFE